MKIIDKVGFSMTDQDISALAALCGSPCNLLSIVREAPLPEETAREFLASLGGLEKEHRDIMQKMSRMIAMPSQVSQVQISMINQSISSITFSAVPAEDEITAIITQGSEKVLRMMSPADIKGLIEQSLAASRRSGNSDFLLELSREALIVFIAIMDQFMREEIESMLFHSIPLPVVTVADILDRLDDARNDDFRWHLLFFAGVGSQASLISTPIALVEKAFDELQTLKLLERDQAAGPETGIAFYGLTKLGSGFYSIFRNNLARVAIGIRGVGIDGGIGSEVALLLADVQDMVLFNIAGNSGTIMFINTYILDAYLDNIFRSDIPQFEDLSGKTRAGTAQSSLTIHCPTCGATLRSNAKFCGSCGGKIETGPSCRHCGSSNPEFAKFCGSCGKAI